MTAVYDIHLFDRATGRYSGTQNCQLGYDTVTYDATTIEPPHTTKNGSEWWISLDWPYWIGSGWELRNQENSNAN